MNLEVIFRWSVVGFILVYILQKIDKYLESKDSRDLAGYRYPWRYLIGPSLYLGILIFNLSVTFVIHEYTLGWTGTFILILPAMLFCSMMNLKRKDGNLKGALAAHLRDFPEAVVPD